MYRYIYIHINIYMYIYTYVYMYIFFLFANATSDHRTVTAREMSKHERSGRTRDEGRGEAGTRTRKKK